MEPELIFQLGGGYAVSLECDERKDRGSLDLVGFPDHRGFRDERMAHERALDLGGAKTVPRDVDHIVDPPHDPVISVFIPPGPGARKIDTRYLAPVLRAIPVGVSVDRPEHRWPRFRDDKVAALIFSDASSLLVEDINCDARKRHRGRARFRGSGPGKRCDHNGACFGLPPGIDDGTAPPSNDFMVPHPCLRVDRFADRSEQPERAEIVLQRPLLPPAGERADGCGRSIKNVDAVALDDLPEAVR